MTSNAHDVQSDMFVLITYTSTYPIIVLKVSAEEIVDTVDVMVDKDINIIPVDQNMN